MKKRYILFLPLLIALSACEFNVGFDAETHSAGLDKSYSHSNAQEKVTYDYYSGDNIDSIKNERSACAFSFAFLKDTRDAKSDIKDIDLLNSYFTTEGNNILSTVSEPNYVGVKEGGLFIGAESSYIVGTLTLNCSVPVVAVEIEACSYYYVTTTFNEEKSIVDKESAISINEKNFILLSEEAEKTSLCSYRIDENTQVKISVGKTRAYINSITLYY